MDWLWCAVWKQGKRHVCGDSREWNDVTYRKISKAILQPQAPGGFYSNRVDGSSPSGVWRAQYCGAYHVLYIHVNYFQRLNELDTGLACAWVLLDLKSVWRVFNTKRDRRDRTVLVIYIKDASQTLTTTMHPYDCSATKYHVPDR